MNKKFIKSITAAVASLAVLSACNHMNFGKSHNCTGKCTKKEEGNKCGAANGCAAKKTVKAESKKAVKTEEKK